MGKAKELRRTARREARSCAFSKAAYCAVKRLLDIIMSLVAMIIFSPAFAVAAYRIKREDKGPAIFRQERVGLHGKLFNIYKFRSMKMDAESDGRPQLYKKGDTRLTATGRFLRDHHLDELPQLWNVLKGDMSLVGPRPERPFFIAQIREIRPDIDLLQCVRPGVFSPATLHNGYTDTMDKMLRRLDMDLDYIHNRSLWLDIKIIYLTTLSILTGKRF